MLGVGMRSNVVNRTSGKESLAEFLGNEILVYNIEEDGTKTPIASFNNIYVFANHYALIEYKNPPARSSRLKSVLKSWITLHEGEPIEHISFNDYEDYCDIVIKTNLFYYNVEVAKGTIDFNKIDSDVNYTLESLGL